jgi:arsenate reductase (thioredoxin)
MTDNPTTPGHPQHVVSIDQGLALKAAAERLESEFGDTFDAETIDRFLYAAHAHFAHHASVPNFLPLLAERFAQQQLRALARVEGKHHDGKPTVLFLCTHNAGRSQMAAAFFAELAGEDAVAWSGGSDPSDQVNPAVVQAMSERGIHISHEYPKPFTDEIVQAADVVITMGCGDTCPVIPGRRYEEWTFDDPAGRDVDAVRPIRDAIEQRVRRLLTELNVAVRA